ncbi:ATP synthase subunit delta', mitochondrial, partial [Sesamum angolense]
FLLRLELRVPGISHVNRRMRIRNVIRVCRHVCFEEELGGELCPTWTPQNPIGLHAARPSTASAASTLPSSLSTWFLTTVPNCERLVLWLQFRSVHFLFNIVPALGHVDSRGVFFPSKYPPNGQMGILPGHVASISELKAGLLSIHEGNEMTKYFISSGFVFIHSNSVTDIIAIEAVPIEQVDPDSVQKYLKEFTQKLSAGSTDLEKAEAQIGLDVLSTLNSSLSG